jgi:putative iron-dependent peroxidase
MTSPHVTGIPQSGIFALGAPAHVYLEFDRTDAATAESLIGAAVAATDALASVRALNVVIGFRPELWADVTVSKTPSALHGFNEPVAGPDGFTMPATQRDVVIWIAGAAYDMVFDASQGFISALAPVGHLASNVHGWHYHENRDLTGFVDGTKNPMPTEAPRLVLLGHGCSAGGSVLLLQQWMHEPRWRELPPAEQEAAIGRTIDTDDELSPRPETSHVARTDQDTFGHILRRNTAFGTAERHGTMFVGFSATQKVLADMLDSMAGHGGTRDALTLYTTPVSGSYYYIPSLRQLQHWLPPND